MPSWLLLVELAAHELLCYLSLLIQITSCCVPTAAKYYFLLVSNSTVCVCVSPSLYVVQL